MTHTLGIEFGSTRIKAVLIDETFATVVFRRLHLEERALKTASGPMPLEEAWKRPEHGAARRRRGLDDVAAVGVSGHDARLSGL